MKKKQSWGLLLFRGMGQCLIKPYVAIVAFCPLYETLIIGPILYLLLRLRLALNPKVRMAKRLVDGMTIYCFEPRNQSSIKHIYHIHGGGMTFGCVGLYNRFLIKSVEETGMAFYFPAYSLAPRKQYPTAIEEIYAGYHSLLDSGISQQELIIGGDSAGGNYALQLLLKLRDTGERMPLGAYLESPFLDLSLSAPSTKENVLSESILPLHGPLRHLGALLLNLYYCPGIDSKDPRVSPLFADLHGLPPLYISYSKDECLRDDSERLIAKLKDLGQEPEVRVFHKTPHVNMIFCGIYPEATEAFENFVDFLHKERPL